MPLQATSGAASYDGFGGGAAVVPAYIEEIFSTYLYTGNGSTQTITNGIDLSTKGGLVWTKARNVADDSRLFDTSSNSILSSSLTNAKLNGGNALVPTYVTFNTNGFYTPNDYGGWNTNATTYVSWTFREQPKFFDVVTYTGTGSARTVAHNLGSTPGCIIVKRTDAAIGWPVYHRGLTSLDFLLLDATSASSTAGSFWDDTNPTPTNFTVGSSNYTNASGGTYVAYLFAHDAGGFGLTGTDNVISCGSFNSTDSGSLITLGYEPQFVLWKKTNSAGGWFIADTMRGLTSNPPSNGQANTLYANTSGAEAGLQYYIGLDSKGFYEDGLGSGSTYIYIAIRRGPMKVPTLGTSVYNAIARTGTGAAATITGVGFPPDLNIFKFRAESGSSGRISDRLRGAPTFLNPDSTGSEGTAGNNYASFDMDGVTTQSASNGVNYASTQIHHFLRRAPGFFDEVCYTGTGVARTVTHNLAAVPELMIIKVRSPTGYAWRVYAAPLGVTQSLRLNTDDASETDTYWNGTAPTSTVFSVNNYGQVNNSGSPIVAYLFATCAGVSKVGSYTGTATTKQIDCGFTAGARFVLIKRTDSTGDWYVWDSARGIVAGNDPYLLLNSTAAEVTSTDYVDTYSAGFEISSTAPAAINASGGTFIFLAIA